MLEGVKIKQTIIENTKFLLIEAIDKPKKPEEWFEKNAKELKRLIVQNHGAILFRNFHENTAEAFNSTLKSLKLKEVKYDGGGSPGRKKVFDMTYTSTSFPNYATLFMHNELSYTLNSPKFVFFFCVQPAEENGETVIGDSKLIYEKMDKKLIESLSKRGVKYSRYFYNEDLKKENEGISKSWQLSFNTKLKEEVERISKEIGYSDLIWDNEDNLEIRTKSLQVIREHPETKNLVWFNQIQGWDPRIALIMKNIPNRDENKVNEYNYSDLYNLYPQGCYYGDNDEIINFEDLMEINKLTWENVYDIKWESGDFIWIDNYQTCHGKRPHKGNRKILASLANDE